MTEVGHKYLTPRAMIENIRDGRYAVEIDDKWVFLRVSRPKHGARKGAQVIQTQHSESYREALVIRADGSLFAFNTKPNFDHALMIAACDPFTSAINYGRELGRCSRCGRELTDERSRWYSIGPECEKFWPEIINYIDEERGAFA